MKNPFPIFDGHNDTVLRYFQPAADDAGKSFMERSDKGHIDMVRAREGGLAGGFFAIFVPEKKKRGKRPRFSDFVTPTGYAAPLSSAIKPTYAHEFTLSVMAKMFQLERESQGKFKIVRDVDTLSKRLKKNNGTMSAILHFEGAEAIDTDLNALEVFYQAGLRSLGIVWSRPNAFAEGVPFAFPQSPDTGPGLTDAGKALVRACNQLGILLDLSHLNEKGFWDVAALSDAPLVATHSNVHALCPLTRNLTDKQLDAIRETDGMVGLNFGVSFLREDGKADVDTPLEVMVNHIDYLVERVGIDRVGLGSDFDGTSVPQGITDAAGLPNLIQALRQGGYDDEALRKITHENWLRVLRKTWKEN